MGKGVGSATKSLTSPATTADGRLDPKGARSSRGPRVWIIVAGRICERALQLVVGQIMSELVEIWAGIGPFETLGWLVIGLGRVSFVLTASTTKGIYVLQRLTKRVEIGEIDFLICNDSL